jgi:long-chain acyl-CoA synthetase
MREHLAELLNDLRRFDRGIAVVHYRGNRRRATTYAELARLAGRFAALLAARDIGPGDRVLLWAENSAEWVSAFYGCMLRGVLAVPLDAYGSAEFASRVAADVQPRLVVGDALLLSQLEGTWPKLAFDDLAGILPSEEAGAVPGLGADTPLQILFTSGTTGEPKGIVHTHGNVVASVWPIEEAAQRYMRYERLVHPLRFLHTLPLSHVYGQMMGMWVPAIFAAEVHFESRLVAPRLLETIKRERISVLAAVPRVMALLKTYLETSQPGLAEQVTASQGIGPWMRWWRFRAVHQAFGFKFWALISGGGALPGPLEQFWNGLGFVVVQGYGMTETTALITLNHPFHVARGTLGKPLPGREVKLGPDGEVLVRGPGISGATWSGGEMRPRVEEWLATGDLAERQTTGELRFMGRKSETIVTSTGVNLHPEDLEAAIEQEPGVTGCAVVPMETINGPEACAVLAVRGAETQAAKAIEHANTRLAEFQRVRRWVLWPEPDLPRTSTGKVRRRAVAMWLDGIVTAAAGGAGAKADFSAGGDWLLALIAEIAGEAPPGVGDELRLAEDLHLDSLGRVQLAAAIEERLGMPPESGLLEEAHTLGDLRGLIAGDGAERTRNYTAAQVKAETQRGRDGLVSPSGVNSKNTTTTGRPVEEGMAHPEVGVEQETYLYPHWPWLVPAAWLRTAFQVAVARPLVRLLANPRVTGARVPTGGEPMLIVANHVTAYDGPLVEYALPASVRRRMAVAMSGEMLEDYRHFRSPEAGPGQRRFMLSGPLVWLLLTALFNVFPLPRRRNFERSFRHAGEALDRGFNVLVFPEGTRSAAGELALFRPGIGLLAKQSWTAVLPVAIRGLGKLKVQGRGWFRSGTIEVRVGEPLRFARDESETEITTRLHAEVKRLLSE